MGQVGQPSGPVWGTSVEPAGQMGGVHGSPGQASAAGVAFGAQQTERLGSPQVFLIEAGVGPEQTEPAPMHWPPAATHALPFAPPSAAAFGAQQTERLGSPQVFLIEAGVGP